MRMKLADPEQATLIYSMQTKGGDLSFQGESITFRYYRGRPTNTTKSTVSIVTVLTNLVKSRYNTSAKFLDLSNIAADVEFSASKLKGFEANADKTKFGAVLCKIIQQQCDGVQTISLSDNKLKTLDFFSTMMQRVPNLVNLSLKDNLLTSYKDIEPIKGSHLVHLREVLLSGNPIKDREIGKTGTDSLYKTNIKKIFPSILMLDMEPLNSIQEIAAPIPEVYAGFSDSQGTFETATAFLQAFFPLFDGNRPALENYYAENATFSLSVSTIQPAGRRIAVESNRDLFSGWLPFDRNLDSIKSVQLRAKRIYTGNELIMKIFSEIPKTAHPLAADPSKKLFVIDTFQFGTDANASLLINLHGEFVDSKGKKSFDRTFILRPALQGSKAANSNIPICIVNDSMTIRHLNTAPSWQTCIEASKGGTATTIYPQLPPPHILALYQTQFQLVFDFLIV